MSHYTMNLTVIKRGPGTEACPELNIYDFLLSEWASERLMIFLEWNF